MDDEVHRASGGRSPDTSPDSEMVEGGSIGRRPVGRRRNWVRRREQWLRRCSLTYTCITSSIYGLMSGARKSQRAMWLSSAMPTILWWVFSTGFLKDSGERLANFGLELHADETRLIEFGQFAARDRKQRGEGKPETFTISRTVPSPGMK